MHKDDPIFAKEQTHLSETYATLRRLARTLTQKLSRVIDEAAADKKSMSEEVSCNLATWDDAMETYADFAAINRIIDSYNLAHDTCAEELTRVQLLLKQPYFAKLVLQFKPDEAPKEIYIGNAGVADESYRRIVIDWRSPVAEVYYNQDTGPTSYRANGRVINVDLLLRRQFDIERDELRAYFDTNIAIQDSLLLASLSRERTEHMQAITATIQKEQNSVIRHPDVDALLVFGIAGSGKTSVLLQRIAYLFYQMRENLNPREVFLITPNAVFRNYISDVLPDLGETNPHIFTWSEFIAALLPKGQGEGTSPVTLADLKRIEDAICKSGFEFEPGDFRSIAQAGTQLISADSVAKLSQKFKRASAGPHRVTLMREELHARLEARLRQMAGSEQVIDELSSLSIDEQLRIFHETIAPQTEREEHTLALRYLRDKYADAFTAVENDEWLRIDRIGMRLLGVSGLTPLTWVYLKMTLTGMCNADAKYVVIDEVQDYSVAELSVLARYFRRAHIMALGDPNQAIFEGNASADEIRDVLQHVRGSVAECRLMTSYRSTPEITKLFASLLDNSERMKVSAVQRSEIPPRLVRCDSQEAWECALRDEAASAREGGGLCAIIAAHAYASKLIAQALGDNEGVISISEGDTLPHTGVVLITLKLAKGLEFDHVIIPDASSRTFPQNETARRRLYTTISRATRRLTILTKGPLTPLLDAWQKETSE